MKNAFRFFLITIFAVIIGFTMASCIIRINNNEEEEGEIDHGSNPLAVGEWKHGELTSENSEVQYSFSVKASVTYYLWWNDSKQGDGSKTGNIKISARFSDGTEDYPSPPVSNVDDGWNRPQELYWIKNSSDQDSRKIIYITIEPYDSSSFGTYSITYNTTGIRPSSTWAAPPADPAPLEENTWKVGTIASSSNTDSIPVLVG